MQEIHTTVHAIARAQKIVKKYNKDKRVLSKDLIKERRQEAEEIKKP